MQQFVAERVEEKLRETPDLDYLQTYCISDRMLTLVQLKDAAREQAAEDAWYQVRKKLDDIRGELPPGVLGPAVNDEYGDVYSAIYAFTGDDYSYAELKRLCKMARTRLLRLDNIEKVEIIGEQEEQILVEFSHRKLSTLGITPLQIFDSVERQGAMLRSGSIDTDSDRIHVRVSRDFSGLDQLEAIPVEAAGKLFRLGDVAKVTRGITQRNDLGMRRRVATSDGAIRPATDHAFALHHERTHGHLACQGCRSRELESFAHAFAVGDQRTTCQRV